MAQCLILPTLTVKAATTKYVAVVFISMYTISWVIKRKRSPKVSYCTMMASCTHAQLVTHSSLAMVQYISLSQSVIRRFFGLKRDH